MKVKNKGSVCVIGAGIIGATTAYALSKEGWSVTVVDSNQEAGMGASFANGAQLSYSYVEPLATPETLKKSLFGCSRAVVQYAGYPSLIGVIFCG